VEAAFRLDQSVLLELTGLLARLTIVVSFLYFLRAWKKTVLPYW
jgi:hypothetical protein